MNFKKILFVADNFYPEVCASTNRSYANIKAWRDIGHKIEVVTTAPNFPKGKVFEGYKNWFQTTHEIKDIPIHRVLTFIVSNSGFFLRILDFLSFAFFGALRSLFIKSDIIYTSSPQFFVNFIGLFYKLFKRKKWILEIRDLWPESIVAVGKMNEGVVYNILKKLEHFFYRYADEIIVVTKQQKETLVNEGIEKDKIHIFYNGISSFEENKVLNDSLSEFEQYTDKKVLGYLGTIGDAHDLESIIHLIKEIPKYHLLIVGEGAKKKKLESIIKKENIQNVSIHNGVSRDLIPFLIKFVDIGLVHLKNNKTFRGALPSKIFELASLRVPIMCGVQGEAREMINHYKIGSCFELTLESFKRCLDEIFEKEIPEKKFKDFEALFQRKNIAIKIAEQLF